MFIFRPFPFRLQNENTGEALSLWHLTSPAPPAPLHVASTETGPEVIASSPSKPDNQQRSFVLRRHALTGPLLPLHLVPAAISNTVCLQVHLCKFFSIISYKNFFTLLLLLQKLFAFWFYNNKLSYVHISHLCRMSKGKLFIFGWGFFMFTSLEICSRRSENGDNDLQKFELAGGHFVLKVIKHENPTTNNKSPMMWTYLGQPTTNNN